MSFVRKLLFVAMVIIFSQPPNLNAQLKLHKPGNPIRPVIIYLTL